MEKTKEQIEGELKNLLLKIIDIDPDELKPNAHFFKDLGVDSIKAIEMTVAIEKYFKISIQEEKIEELTTLSKASQVIFDNLKNKKV
jgi:acyl carrier protein